MFFCYFLYQKVEAFGKSFATVVISLPEFRPLSTRPEGKSMCLHGRPLSGSTLLPPWDSVLLHLTFHSISPGFILRTIGSWGGEAANVLTQANIDVIFNGHLPFRK